MIPQVKMKGIRYDCDQNDDDFRNIQRMFGGSALFTTTSIS